MPSPGTQLIKQKEGKDMTSFQLLKQELPVFEIHILHPVKYYFYHFKLIAAMALLSFCMLNFLVPYYTGDSVQDLAKRMRRRTNRELLSDYYPDENKSS